MAKPRFFAKSEGPIIESPKVVEKAPRKEGFCDCGEPVAAELGQDQVCKKHMRNS